MTLTMRAAAACGRVLAETPPVPPYLRTVPRIEGPRPEAAALTLWQHFFEPAEPPRAAAVLLENAILLGPGIILADPATLVAESLANCDALTEAPMLQRAAPGLPWAATAAPDPPFLPGTHLALRQMWDGNYGHWLIDTLSRLCVLGDALPPACAMLVSDHGGNAAALHAVQTESLAALGIGPARIRRVGWNPLRVERLVFITPLSRQPWLKSPLLVEALERLGASLPAPRSPPRSAPARLYLRRQPGARRALENEAALWPLLQSRGFVAASPGSLRFTQQATLMRAVTHVVAPLGAECANLVFAPRGCTLLGLAPEGMQDDFFYDLVSLKEGRYFSLHGPAAGDMNADFAVDPDRFAAMLDTALTRA